MSPMILSENPHQKDPRQIKIINCLTSQLNILFVIFVGTLEELLQQEDKVLESWTTKKKRLDQCLQYVLFERSARQVCKTEISH